MSQVEEKLFAVERNRIIPSIRGFEIRTEVIAMTAPWPCCWP